MANKTRPNMSCLNQISRKQCLIRTIGHNHWLELPNQNWTIEDSFEIRRWLAKLILILLFKIFENYCLSPYTLSHYRLTLCFEINKTEFFFQSKWLSNSDWWFPNNCLATNLRYLAARNFMLSGTVLLTGLTFDFCGLLRICLP